MLIRAELIGAKPHSATYDGIVETVGDLSAEPRLETMDPGSLMYCLADKGVYVKTPSGSWEAAV